MELLFKISLFILFIVGMNFRDFLWKDEFFKFSSKGEEAGFIIRNAISILLFIVFFFISN